MPDPVTCRTASRHASRLFLCLGLAVGSLFAIPQAEAALCPSSREKPQLRVLIESAEATWDHSLDEAEIKAVTDRERGYVAGPWHRPIGLTTAKFSAYYATSFSIRKATGGYCAYLAQAEVTIGYDEMMVYINRNYPEGSCQYDVVVEHELEHVRANEETLKEYRPEIVKALKRMVRSKSGIFVHRKAEARSAYLLAMKRSLEPVLEQMAAERNRRNDRLDSRDNYAREQAKCPSW